MVFKDKELILLDEMTTKIAGTHQLPAVSTTIDLSEGRFQLNMKIKETGVGTHNVTIKESDNEDGSSADNNVSQIIPASHLSTADYLIYRIPFNLNKRYLWVELVLAASATLAMWLGTDEEIEIRKNY